MSENRILSQAGAARELGVHPRTIGDIVQGMGIKTRPMSNGKAKGLDAAAMRKLRKILGRDRKPEPSCTV